MTSPLAAASAKRALFERLIDDASLFPPASLDMGAALRAHVRHRESGYAFCGGRFVVPASRLPELLAERDASAQLELSVILDRAARDGAAIADDLHDITAAEQHAGVRVTAYELRAPSTDPTALAAALAALAGARSGGDVAIEIPYDVGYAVPPERFAPLLAGLKANGQRVLAKLRCGGEAPPATPSVDDLAAAIVALGATGVAIKATAGLHHPVRGHRHGDVVMHGFLNVAFAAIGLHAGVLDPARVVDVIAETDPRAFVVDPVHVAWRDVSLDDAAVVAGREAAFVAFGSCSFDEPVDDLRGLGILA